MLANNYMSKLYEREREHVLEKLALADTYYFTLDVWKSCQNRSYEMVTIHYVDQDFVLQSRMLITKEFLQSYNGANIAEEIWSVLDEWNPLSDQVSQQLPIMDQKMVLAMELMEWVRIPHSAISSRGCTKVIYGVQCISNVPKIGEPFSPLHKIHLYAMAEVN